MNGHSEPPSASVHAVAEDCLAVEAWASRAGELIASSDKASSPRAKGKDRPATSRRTKSRRLGATKVGSRCAVCDERMVRTKDGDVFIDREIFVAIEASVALLEEQNLDLDSARAR